MGVLGLGEIGTMAAEHLRDLDFPVAGWSRTKKTVPGIESFAGHAELRAFLARSDILVCLLPLTPDTRHILNENDIRDTAAKRLRHQCGARRSSGGRGSDCGDRLGPSGRCGARCVRNGAIAEDKPALVPSEDHGHTACCSHDGSHGASRSVADDIARHLKGGKLEPWSILSWDIEVPLTCIPPNVESTHCTRRSTLSLPAPARGEGRIAHCPFWCCLCRALRSPLPLGRGVQDNDLEFAQLQVRGTLSAFSFRIVLSATHKSRARDWLPRLCGGRAWDGRSTPEYQNAPSDLARTTKRLRNSAAVIAPPRL